MALRILADENVPGDAVRALRDEGHDVVWMVADAPGTPDDVILARAQAEERIVVTFDTDFGELAFRRRLPASSGVVLLRIQTGDPVRAAAVIVAALRTRSDWAGHFSVVDSRRIRMTPLPS